MFPGLEETYPLEKGSQAALQIPGGLWCSAVDCAPKEDTTGGGPAETCCNSASCQLSEGEHWLGIVVLSFLLCSQRRHKSCLDREQEGVPCVKFSDVDPATNTINTLSAVCSNHMFLLQWKEAVAKQSKKEALQPEPCSYTQSSSAGIFGVGKSATMTTSAQHQLATGYSKEAEQAYR